MLIANQPRLLFNAQPQYGPIQTRHHNIQYVTQEQINQPPVFSSSRTVPVIPTVSVPSRIEPSAPTEEHALIPSTATTTPTLDIDYDKPPAYDDLLRTGEVSAILNRKK